MSFVRTEDLPTDQAQLETDVEVFFADLDGQIQAVLILGQLDPTEVVVTKVPDSRIERREPRWSAEQQDLIIKAKDQLEDWKS